MRSREEVIFNIYSWEITINFFFFMQYPVAVTDTEQSKLFYKQDTKFKTPKGQTGRDQYFK